MVKYHNFFLVGTRKKFASINFPGGRKNWKMAIFGLHYIKVSSFCIPMQWTSKIFYEFTNLNSSKLQWPQEISKRSIDYKTSKLSLKNDFFRIFLVRTWFLRSMGAVAQNWLIPQKFHKNRNCRVSKSKIIMGLWFLALKARKAGNWPRTFYTGTTYQNKTKNNTYYKSSSIYKYYDNKRKKKVSFGYIVISFCHV